MRKGDVHDQKVGVWVLQFLTSQSNHAHSGLHGGNYVHYLHYILMHETSTQRSVFERRLAKKEGENTFGRSCIVNRVAMVVEAESAC